LIFEIDTQTNTPRHLFLYILSTNVLLAHSLSSPIMSVYTPDWLWEYCGAQSDQSDPVLSPIYTTRTMYKHNF